MQASIILSVLGAAIAAAQAGAGYPPPPAMTLSTALSGVLPVLPTATPFSGVDTEEGAIVYDGPMNPSFTPVLGPATTASSLPAATYQAVLPSTNFDNGTGSTVTGKITISSDPSNSGVLVSVDFSGFPSESDYGPFVYHIHEFAVPADGNCTATVGHLDPTDRGEYYPCNTAALDTCQVGDLAGKHGNITTNDFAASYRDYFLSTDPSSPAFFGDKSVVIHTSNTTRITCANFEQLTGAGASGPSGTPSPSPTGAPAQYTGGAAAVARGSMVGAAGVVAAAFAFFM